MNKVSGLSKAVSHRMLPAYIASLNTPITFQQVGINVCNIGENQIGLIPKRKKLKKKEIKK